MDLKHKLKENHLSTTASVLLLDIEGTTTSISFVKDQLFPYILKNVESYLNAHFEEEQTQADISALRKLAKQDIEDGDNTCHPISENETGKMQVIADVVKNVQQQMSKDRKTTSLKQLQGHMWSNAYETGEVKGHLYDDVADCLKKWTELGKQVCIYSSGSVAAQKLLFQYSLAGDLTELLSAHFDTNVGGKRESSSYSKIAKELEVEPKDILFLTDVIQEAQAAKESGMSAIIMLRPGNVELTNKEKAQFPTMETFDQLEFNQHESSDESGDVGKKKKRE